MQRGFIDRIEGDVAVIAFEGGRVSEFRRERLPEQATAGDAVVMDEDGKLLLDPAATKARKQDIEQLMDELFE